MDASKRYKIAIVGGGPAGSTAAIQLVLAGVDPGDIVLFDKAVFPRPKLCGGAITWRGTQILTQMLGVRPDGGTVTQGLRLDAGDVGGFTIYEPGPQWLYDRGLLDHLLLKQASALGVIVHEDTEVVDVEPGSEKHTVRLKQTHVQVDWLIAADGAAGIVPRRLGLDKPRTGRLVEGVFEPVNAALDPQWLYFNFEPVLERLPAYAWIFPYPKPDGGRAWKIGIMDGRGVVPGSNLRQWTLDYAERNGFRALESRLPGWPERYYSRTNRAHVPGIVLLGEAWGIDAFLGEGITPAMQMAKYAAQKIKWAMDRGRRDIPRFETSFWLGEEGWNLYFHDFLAQRLYGPDGAGWLRLVFGSPGLQALGASRRVAYGKMARHALPLTASVGAGLLRYRGLPGI